MFDYKEEHKKLCDLMHETYIKKNTDYGNSFSNLYADYGSIISEIHLREKFDRFKQLRTSQAMVNESIEDTLMDLANYCILTVLEMKKLKSYEESEMTTVTAEEVVETQKNKEVEENIDEIKSQFKRENHDTEYLFDGATEEEIEKIKSSNGCRK